MLRVFLNVNIFEGFVIFVGFYERLFVGLLILMKCGRSNGGSLMEVLLSFMGLGISIGVGVLDMFKDMFLILMSCLFIRFC